MEIEQNTTSSLLPAQEKMILIVDDNPTNLGVLASYFEDVGLRIVVAHDGQEAINTIRDMPPDLILLDVMMPGINGFETCRLLKADETTCHIPVIFMTALNETQHKLEGFETGAVDYVTKPIQYAEVLARVTTHLRIRDLQTQLEEQNHMLEDSNAHLRQEILAREQAERSLKRANEELQRLAMLDGLTQIANRRWFDEYLQIEWQRSVRQRLSLALIMCDIDYFKHYNDTYGHQGGDKCLQEIAAKMSRTVKRPADFVARYGGEEFAIILPETTQEGAMHVALMIQEAIRWLNIPHGKSSVSEIVTLSLGVAAIMPDLETASSTLIAAADKALYEAKEQGRNRAILQHDSQNWSIT